MGTLHGLRRRIATLVYRDAARAHGFAVALVVLVAVYLAQAWPPPEIRAAVTRLPSLPRATALALVVTTYVALTTGVCRTLLASRRLEPFRALPISRAWWARTQLWHLVVLDAAWWAAIAYGLRPQPTRRALLMGVAAAGTTVAGQIGWLVLADRPMRRIAIAAALLVTTIAAWAEAPPWLAASLGIACASLAVAALRDPIVEPVRVRHGRARRMRGPVRAWARLLWLGVTRRKRMTACTLAVVPAGLVALVLLARAHVGVDEPASVAAMTRVCAVVGAFAGASVLVPAVRAIDRDRWRLDVLPLSTRSEHVARVAFAASFAAPVLGLGATTPAAALEAVLAVVWAALAVADLIAGRERARALHAGLIGRALLVLSIALALVVAVGSALALVPWIALALLRAERRLHAASAVRMRFETAREDDDHA